VRSPGSGKKRAISRATTKRVADGQAGSRDSPIRDVIVASTECYGGGGASETIT